MKLSVIIPVYKVERTLDRCVESVLRQGIDGELEIILVDDGSPDNCPQLCDAWKEKLSSPNSKATSTNGTSTNGIAHSVQGMAFRVIHKPNGGLSDARNKGMEIATGDLITFIDSDDELAPDTYPALVRFMQENPDVDVLEYPIIVHAGHASEHRLDLEDRTWQSAKEYWEQTEAWEHCYACNKIFRRGILEGMLFPVGRVFEDMWVYPELLSKNPKVATTSKGLYRYLWNDDSITVTANGNSVTQLLEAQLRAKELMHTVFLSVKGWKLYLNMLYRQIDVYRLTGRILLKFPLCKAICELHRRFIYIEQTDEDTSRW